MKFKTLHCEHKDFIWNNLFVIYYVHLEKCMHLNVNNFNNSSYSKTYVCFKL